MKLRALPKGHDLYLIVIAMGVSFGAVLSLATSICALVASHRWMTPPGGIVGGAPAVLFNLDDPGRALGHGVHIAPIFVWVVACCISLAAACMYVGMRKVLRTVFGPRRPIRPAGFATTEQIHKTMSDQAVLLIGSVTRPSLERPTVLQVGISLGVDVHTGIRLYASTEDTTIVNGPPRCGKTAGLIIPILLDFPGPAAVTSTRDDIFRYTNSLRGQVYLFDPTLVVDTRYRAGWSPVTGCDNPMIAILRAHAFVFASGVDKGITESGFWAGHAEETIQTCLYAAAVGGRDMRPPRPVSTPSLCAVSK